MSVQTGGETGQAPAPQAPAGQAPAAQQDPQQPPTTPGQAPEETPGSAEFDPSTITDPVLKAYLEKQDAELTRARGEAARFRTEKQTLAQQVQEQQRAGETAEQTAQRVAQETQQDLENLRSENRTLKVGTAVFAAATAAKAHDPGTIHKLIDAEVELGEDGKPTNLKALLADLKRTHPFLFRKDPAGADAGGAGGGTPPPATGGVNAMLRGAGKTTAR